MVISVRPLRIKDKTMANGFSIKIDQIEIRSAVKI